MARLDASVNSGQLTSLDKDLHVGGVVRGSGYMKSIFVCVVIVKALPFTGEGMEVDCWKERGGVEGREQQLNRSGWHECRQGCLSRRGG